MRFFVLLITAYFAFLGFSEKIFDYVGLNDPNSYNILTEDNIIVVEKLGGGLGYSYPENSLWILREQATYIVAIKIIAIVLMSTILSLIVRYYTQKNLKAYLGTAGIIVTLFYIIDGVLTYQFKPNITVICWLVGYSLLGALIAHYLYRNYPERISRAFEKFRTLVP